jgi:leucyl-tRNA synthetase
MLCPAAPHITDELWSRRLAATGSAWSSIHSERWPEFDPTASTETTREVPVQVNGKLRDKLTVPSGTEPAALERMALDSPKITAILAGRTPDRVISPGGKLVNIVIREG